MTDVLVRAPAADAAPEDVTAQLKKLGGALDQVVPPKRPGNVLIGTWNVRAFDRVNPKWRSSAGDKPVRDRSNVAAIAEIVSRFDVVAIQEVRQSAAAFLAMLEALGRDWAFLVTDVTGGGAGNNERLAFVFDTRRVHPSGLACELVTAPAKDGVSTAKVFDQFARTPYAVSFARDATRFTLVTLHVLYGKKAADRLPELAEIADWLARWTARRDVWGENLMALGDFNIDRKDDPLYEAFTSTGLRPPDGLNFVPRTIFDDPDPKANPDHSHFYDQIAWFPEGRSRLSMPFVNAGTFDFANTGLIPADSQIQLSWRISDHLPLWCEFNIS